MDIVFDKYLTDQHDIVDNEVKKLVENGENISNDYHGTTYFHKLVFYGRNKLVIWLIENLYCDIKIKNTSGQYALQDACFTNNVELAIMFHNAGCKLGEHCRLLSTITVADPIIMTIFKFNFLPKYNKKLNFYKNNLVTLKKIIF